MQMRMAARRSALWLALALLLLAAAAGGLRWWQWAQKRVPPGATLIERADRPAVAYLPPPEAD